MKILYIDTENFWRGGQEQLFSLICGMKQAGHEIMLASPSTAPLSEKVSRLGIRTINFDQRMEISPKAFRFLYSLMKNNPVDIIHFNTPQPVFPGGLAAKLLAFTKGKRPVTVCSRRVNFPLKYRLSRWKYNHLTDRVLTVSESIRKTLLNSGIRSNLVETVYEGIDPDWNDAQKPAALPFCKDSLVVGTVAHLSQEKGHVDILKAISLLRDKCPEACFVFVGEGLMRSELEEYARDLGVSDIVHFTGFREDSEALMKNFDIFCLPSLSEGLSSAIMSAMACSLPVISTNVGGIPELVIHGKTGLLTEPSAPDQLAESLLRLLTSPEERIRFGREGRKIVETRFTIRHKLEKTEYYYKLLLSLNN
jgi:glycosyltransferase involved in cell wall biosynthesis